MNGPFVKWLGKAVAVVVSVQVADSGAVGFAADWACRLMSFMYRHWNGTPAWLTWSVCARSAAPSPRTSSQPP